MTTFGDVRSAVISGADKDTLDHALRGLTEHHHDALHYVMLNAEPSKIPLVWVGRRGEHSSATNAISPMTGGDDVVAALRVGSYRIELCAIDGSMHLMDSILNPMRWELVLHYAKTDLDNFIWPILAERYGGEYAWTPDDKRVELVAWLQRTRLMTTFDDATQDVIKFILAPHALDSMPYMTDEQRARFDLAMVEIAIKCWRGVTT